MSDLNVAMNLAMTYSPAGAQQAKADLEGIAEATRKVNQAKGDQLTNELKEIASTAGTATQSVGDLGTATSGISELTNSFEGTSKAADEAGKSINKAAKELSFFQSIKQAFRDGFNETYREDGEAPVEPEIKKQPSKPGPSLLKRGASAIPGLARFAASSAILGTGAGIAAFGVLNMVAASSRTFKANLDELQLATRANDEQMLQYAESIRRMSRETGKAKGEISKFMSTTGKMAGGPKRELEKFTSYAMNAAKTWTASAETIGQGFSKISHGWKSDVRQIEEIGNAIGAVAKKAKMSEADLIKMAAADGRRNFRLGIKPEEVVAWGAAFFETGTEIEQASAAFSSFRDHLVEAKNGSKEFKSALQALKLSPKAVEKGMKVDASGTMLAILKLVGGIKDTEKRIKILKALVGESNSEAFMDLIERLEEVNKNLDITKDKAANAKAAMDDLNAADAKTGARLQKMTNRAGQFWDENISLPAMEIADDISEKIISWIETQDQNIQQYRRQNEETKLHNQQSAAQDKLNSDTETVRKWRQLNQYRGELQSDVDGGNWFKKYFSGAQLDELHRLDQEVQSIFNRWGETLNQKSPFDLTGITDSILTLPGAAQTSMQQYSSVLTDQGQIAIGKAENIAGQIRSLLSFDAKITISPSISAPGVSAPVTNAPSKPQRGAAGGKTITIGSVNVSGVRDLASLERQITRAADRQARGQRGDALHSTGGFA